MKPKNIKLEPIVYDEELTAFETTADDWDPYATTLVLDDYDWMNYKLTAHLPTKAYGKMRVRFEFCGMGHCTMQISGTKGYKKDNEVFKNYVRCILRYPVAAFAAVSGHGAERVATFIE